MCLRIRRGMKRERGRVWDQPRITEIVPLRRVILYVIVVVVVDLILRR